MGLELNPESLFLSEWVHLTNVVAGFWNMDAILEMKYVCRYWPRFIFRAVVSELSYFILLSEKNCWRWSPIFVVYLYTNHLLLQLLPLYRYFINHTENWNAKEWDKTSIQIEFLIFSHSSVDGLVYALRYINTYLETVLQGRGAPNGHVGCSKSTSPTLSCFPSLQENSLLWFSDWLLP